MARPSSTAATMEVKLSSARTMSEADLATAVPEPIAIPISAFFKAGASLTPSPVYKFNLITGDMDHNIETMTYRPYDMTYHSSDVTIALEVFNNLLFVGWFDTGEAL